MNQASQTVTGRIFGDVEVHLLVTILYIPIEALSVFLIYIIWKHSPDKMQSYKYFVMKMATTDLCFSIIIGHLYQPVLLFPLPAAGAAGLLQYAEPVGGKIGYGLVLCAGLATLYSVNDCCIARCMIIYGRNDWLQIFKSKIGVLYFLAMNGGCFAVFYVMLHFSAVGYPELVQYAKRHHFEEYLRGTYSEMPLIAFDLDDPLLFYLVIAIVLTLFATEGVNISLSWAVQRRLNKARSSMSPETFKMQRNLTIMLLLQMIIPFVSLSIPIIVYAVAFVTDTKEIYDSFAALILSSVLIGGYPLFNDLCCIFMMKPYRVYIRNLLSRIFPCIPLPSTVQEITNIGSSMA